MIQAEQLARAGCPYLGVPYSDMDCQKFVEKCLSDVGISKDLAGSNAWFRTMTWVGTPKECKQKFGKIPPGAFLFILENNGKEPEKYKPDGLGNASHIGLYTSLNAAEMVRIAVEAGDEDAGLFVHGSGAIHSSSSRGHVCTSTFEGKAINGGWNSVGLWDKVDYGPEINAILRGGSGPDPVPGPAEYATVHANNGKPVKMRAKPSTSCGTYWEVPVGAQVKVITPGAEWTKISWGGITGYMMSKFLTEEQGGGQVTVVIHGLTLSEANELVKLYPDAEILG